MRGLLPRRRPRRPQEFRREVRAQGPLWRTQSSPLWSLYALNTKYSGSANDAIPNPTASKLCQPFTSLGAVLRMCITQIPQQIDTNTTPIPARIVSSGPHLFSTPGRVKIPPAHPTDRTQRSQPVLMRRTLQPKVSTRLSASSITNVAATGNPRTTVAITKRPVVGDAIARCCRAVPFTSRPSQTSTSTSLRQYQYFHHGVVVPAGIFLTPCSAISLSRSALVPGPAQQCGFWSP